MGRLAGENGDCTGQRPGLEAGVGEPLESVTVLSLFGMHVAVGDSSSCHAVEHPRLVLQPEERLVEQLVRHAAGLGVQEDVDAISLLDDVDDVDTRSLGDEISDHVAQSLTVGQLEVGHRQAGLEFDAQPFGRYISTPDDVFDRIEGHGVSFHRASVVRWGIRCIQTYC
ncbi:MAG: hypothetical protein JWM52_96 [Candidatus Saccharibacteria bacterium]|nr:hypothetical protein [Candidatus Saccharibacteria bacterium]